MLERVLVDDILMYTVWMDRWNGKSKHAQKCKQIQISTHSSHSKVEQAFLEEIPGKSMGKLSLILRRPLTIISQKIT